MLLFLFAGQSYPISVGSNLLFLLIAYILLTEKCGFPQGYTHKVKI